MIPIQTQLQTGTPSEFDAAAYRAERRKRYVFLFQAADQAHKHLRAYGGDLRPPYAENPELQKVFRAYVYAWDELEKINREMRGDLLFDPKHNF